MRTLGFGDAHLSLFLSLSKLSEDALCVVRKYRLFSKILDLSPIALESLGHFQVPFISLRKCSTYTRPIHCDANSTKMRNASLFSHETERAWGRRRRRARSRNERSTVRRSPRPTRAPPPPNTAPRLRGRPARKKNIVFFQL